MKRNHKAYQKETAKRAPLSDIFSGWIQQIQQFDFSTKSNQDIQDGFNALMGRRKAGEDENTLLPLTFALVVEAARRTIGMKPFHTQLYAGMVLSRGNIAQMQTGEGKTLAAVAPACLLALEGKGVHILTYNDYLAKRDALWMGPVYHFLGLTAGFVQEGMTREQRGQMYACDVTYVTVKEAGFDYLRDTLSMQGQEMVHRKLHAAVIDEADSIMIDEARIPMVLAGCYENMERDVQRVHDIVGRFRRNMHFELDEQADNVFLTDAGIMLAERLLGIENLYDQKQEHLLAAIYAGLYAHHQVKRDVDYIVKDNKIQIIDALTGRIADKRLFSNAIQAAVEAKEGIEASSRGSIQGSIAIQHFLSLYPRISGMTGTALSAKTEFESLYHMQIVEIPPYKPSMRMDHSDRIFISKAAKLHALLDEIGRVFLKGQPVLIGTQSVEESEILGKALEKNGIPCRILNAKQDEAEAAIIAEAGSLRVVTVSTNMAGRGVDIKLGGAGEEEREQVMKLGGLYIIGTGRHDSVRIDNQLRGRAGRQGEPGETRFFISLEDDLFQRQRSLGAISPQFLNIDANGEIQNKHVAKDILHYQKAVEGYYSDLRIQLLQFNFIMEQQRRILFRRRMKILLEEEEYSPLKEADLQHYQTLIEHVGEKGIIKASQQLYLYYSSYYWMIYLENMEALREGIHLVVIGNRNPVDTFNKVAIESFDEMQRDIEDAVLKGLKEMEITEAGIEFEKEGLALPSSTWTYLLNLSNDQFSRLPQLIKATSNAIRTTLFSVQSLVEKLVHRVKR